MYDRHDPSVPDTRAAPAERPADTTDHDTSGDPSVYVPPDRGVEPLTGAASLPRVKRFNRRTIGVLAAATAGVAIVAFGTALTRHPVARKVAESEAETTTAAPSAADAVNHLPGSYADVPQLGRPLPGDVGAMVGSDPVLLARAGQGTLGTATYSSPAPAMRSQVSAAETMAARAREGSFGFGGGTAGGGSGATSGSAWPTVPAAGAMPAYPAPPRADRDADNRQDDKQEYLERQRGARWELKDRLRRPPSPFTLLAGTVIPGVLLTGINSDLPGQIEGQISENVYDTVTGQHLILPQGTKLLGSYDSRVTYGQTRVLIVWTRILRPDGSTLDLEGMPGTDLSGYAGLTGKVDRHLTRLLGAVVMGSLIQAGTSAGTSYTDPGFADRFRQGSGQGVNEATQQIVRKELQLQPTIRVAPGARFAVFTTKDVDILPFPG